MTSQPIFYLNYLRVFACFLIVMVHVSASEFSSVSPRSISWQSMNFYDCFGILGVPLFVMISGAVMLNSPKVTSISYFLKKACKLYILYYAWGFFYNCIGYFPDYTFTLTSFKDEVILKTLVIGVHYHLWFLPMLITLYLLTPIFATICASRRLLEYSLVLYILFVLFFPTLFLYDFPYRTIVQSTFNRLPFTYLGGYTGYYLLGYYLHNYSKEWKKSHCIILAIGSILSFITIVFLCGYDGYLHNYHSVIVNNPLTIFHIITGSGFFLLCKRLFGATTKAAPCITLLTPLTLGIYFLHPLLISLLTDIGITTLSFTPLLSIPMLTLFIFLGCAILLFICSKIPLVKHLF